VKQTGERQKTSSQRTIQIRNGKCTAGWK